MNDTALLVIDMQNGFLSPVSPLYIAGAEILSFERLKF